MASRIGHNDFVTEPFRPPTETAASASLSGFAAKNAAWGLLLGACISIAWMIARQDFWFAQYVVLIGAGISAVWGAISAMPAFIAGRATRHVQLLVVGVVFANTAMLIQVALILLLGGHPTFIWLAAAYATLGAVVAVLIFWGGRASGSDRVSRGAEDRPKS